MKKNIIIQFNDGSKDLILDDETSHIEWKGDQMYISHIKLSNIIPISKIERIKFD